MQAGSSRGFNAASMPAYRAQAKPGVGRLPKPVLVAVTV